MAAQLKYTDEYTAKAKINTIIKKSYSTTDLLQLDRMIDSINGKVNSNDANTLFDEEVAYLKQMRTPKNTLSAHSFFQTKKQEQNIGFWQWIASWFGSDYSGATADENRLMQKKQ